MLVANCSNAQVHSSTHISFEADSLKHWETRSFAGETDYSIVELDDQHVLRAQSKMSASAIALELPVDITQTPYLNWRWRVENTFGLEHDEQSKDGDDYPARLYVVVSDGYQPWEVIALNYVWSSNQSVGTTWSSAWTNKAKMIAVESGDSSAGQWVVEKRNLLEDFHALFDRDVTTIKAVAIMVDSDNHGGSATSYFGDIFFSTE